MCLTTTGFGLQLVKWPRIPSSVASEITDKRFSACVMMGGEVHLHLSLLWCCHVAPSLFISNGDSTKPPIWKTHTPFVCAGCEEQTQESWFYFLTLATIEKDHLKQPWRNETFMHFSCPECFALVHRRGSRVLRGMWHVAQVQYYYHCSAVCNIPM